MMNAEVTAENKPACTPGKEKFVQSECGTDEDQGRVQIIVMFLEESLIILFGHFAIVLVEPRPMILLSRNRVMFLAMREARRDFGWIRKKVALRFLPNALFPVPLFFKNMTAIEG